MATMQLQKRMSFGADIGRGIAVCGVWLGVSIVSIVTFWTFIVPMIAVVCGVIATGIIYEKKEE